MADNTIVHTIIEDREDLWNFCDYLANRLERFLGGDIPEGTQDAPLTIQWGGELE